ncbi:hypothetical protein ABKN59_008105 [Abortiporus biennis]
MDSAIPTNLPNPTTPLAWLEPDLAQQVEVGHLFVTGIVGLWAWDVLMSLHEEYHMFKHNPSWVDFNYILARIMTFGVLATTMLFIIGPVDNCSIFLIIEDCLGAITIALNTLLMLHRIRAVFKGSTWIIALFTILWIANFSCLTVISATKAIHLGPTKECLENYTAITASLSYSGPPNSKSNRTIKAFFGGHGLGYVAQTLLVSGQIYYLASVTVNIATVVCVLNPKTPAAYKIMLIVANVAIQNAMACRVHRQLKLGILRRPHLGFDSPPGTFASTVATVVERRQIADDIENIIARPSAAIAKHCCCTPTMTASSRSSPMPPPQVFVTESIVDVPLRLCMMHDVANLVFPALLFVIITAGRLRNFCPSS